MCDRFSQLALSVLLMAGSDSGSVDRNAINSVLSTAVIFSVCLPTLVVLLYTLFDPDCKHVAKLKWLMRWCQPHYLREHHTVFPAESESDSATLRPKHADADDKLQPKGEEGLVGHQEPDGDAVIMLSAEVGSPSEDEELEKIEELDDG